MATLLSDAYNNARRKLVTEEASRELRPGSIAGFGAVIELRREPETLAAGAGDAYSRPPRRRRTDGRTARQHPRRHRAFRHHRPGRQHDLVDAVGRLAAFLAGTSRTRLLPRHPRADVLAARGPPGRARPLPAPAHHTLTHDGAARRRAVSRLGLARRRRPGPMDHAVFPAPRALRHELAGGDRPRRPGTASISPSSFWPRTARPGVLVLEGRVPQKTVAELERRGHIVERGPDWSEGRLTAASRVGRRRRAAANPRGVQGYAAGR